MTLSLFYKKFAAFFIVTMLVVPGFFNTIQARRAMAAVPVTCVNCYTDPSSWISILNQFINTVKNTITAIKTTYLALKEAVLDPIARMLGAQLSNQLAQQMFSFIAKGNNGAPVFVTNPQQYFGSVAEESTQVFLTDLQNNRPDRMASINNAVRQRIIEENYVDAQRKKTSTFPGGDAGYQAYLEKPSSCPTGNVYDCYFEALKCQNDPSCIYRFESGNLAIKRGTDVKLAQDEILAGDGYHTLKSCVEKDIDKNCTEYLNKTPASDIAKTIPRYISAALEQSQLADELEELGGMGPLISRFSSWLTGKGIPSIAENEVGTQGIDQGNGVTTFPLQPQGSGPTVNSYQETINI